MSANGRDSMSEMREPFGKGIDRARDAIQQLPPRPGDAMNTFDLSAKPSRSLAARLSTLSLRRSPLTVKTFRSTGVCKVGCPDVAHRCWEQIVRKRRRNS